MNTQEFRPNDSILTTKGQYRGWIGYWLQYSDHSINKDTSVVLRMDGEGNSFRHVEYTEYLMNLEPYAPRQSW